jgi:hypothetical protein
VTSKYIETPWTESCVSVILDRIRDDRLPIALDGKEYDIYLNLQGALEITYMLTVTLGRT